MPAETQMTSRQHLVVAQCLAARRGLIRLLIGMPICPRPHGLRHGFPPALIGGQGLHSKPRWFPPCRAIKYDAAQGLGAAPPHTFRMAPAHCSLTPRRPRSSRGPPSHIKHHTSPTLASPLKSWLALRRLLGNPTVVCLVIQKKIGVRGATMWV